MAALAMHPEKAGFPCRPKTWGRLVRDLGMDVLVGEDLRIIKIMIIIIIGAKG